LETALRWVFSKLPCCVFTPCSEVEISSSTFRARARIQCWVCDHVRLRRPTLIKQSAISTWLVCRLIWILNTGGYPRKQITARFA
jgi:hypothetical protein